MEPGKGCMARIGLLLLIALFAGVVASVYFIFWPQDLKEIGAYQTEGGEPARDLAVVMEKSLKHGHSLAFTESEINRWLSRTLSCRQGGVASQWVSIDGVWVRLMDGYAEIIIERTMFGRPFTASLYVSIETTEQAGRIQKQVHLHSGPYHESVPRPVRGGRFGRLVVPQGCLIFVMPSFRALAKTFEKEIKLGVQEMSSVRFEERHLILHPRNQETP